VSEQLSKPVAKVPHAAGLIARLAYDRATSAGMRLGPLLKRAGLTRHQIHDRGAYIRVRDQIEFWTTSLVRISRELTGVRLVPSAVRLVHLRSRVASELIRFFGCGIKFGGAVDEVAFPRRLRDLPLLNADPYLTRLLISFCERALSQRSRSLGSMRTKVENAIIPLLPHGDAQASHVAQRLGVSQRSLARHLAHEGLNLSKLLNQLGQQLARR
jgi:hypothetical protein